MSKPTRNVLIDCDTGGDDGVAIMMLLRHHLQGKVNVVGMTCVNGNTPLDNVVHNNIRLLKLFNLYDQIPLFAGCKEPLVHLSKYNTDSIFGKDGLGDNPDMKPRRSDDDLAQVKEKHASEAIVHFSKEHGGNFDIIATGPLTNLAVALRLDPSLPTRVNNIFIMGGTRHGVGDITAAAEYNFYVDPEAAFTTLREFTAAESCSAHLIDYELTKQNPLSKEWIVGDWLGGENKTDKQIFAMMMLNPLIKFYEDVFKTENVIICDPNAMAVALDQSIGLRASHHHQVCVETAGNFSRGHLIWNRTGTNDERFYGPLTLYGGIDMEKYKEMLKDAVV